VTKKVEFGYTHISWPGFEKCPCGDPGNYAAFEVRDGVDTIVCWCGRTAVVKSWTDPDERQQFIDKHRSDLGAKYAEAMQALTPVDEGAVIRLLGGEEARTERAINIAVALEEECAHLRALLTDACAYLTSEGAYDITDLLEKAHSMGIEVY
jgi:hypothetical protein